MAHGLPDYGVYAPKVTVSALADMAELAARLGSIDTFERKGDVLWLDDFNDGIHKWTTELTEDRGSVEWDGNHARNGGFCAKLTSGDEEDDKARIIRKMPIASLSKIGLEVSFTVHANAKTVQFELHLNEGLYKHNIAVGWTAIDKVWTYTLTEGVYVDLEPSVTLATDEWVFHTMKIVADLNTHKFCHLISNYTHFDMTDIPYYYTGEELAPYLHLYVTCIGNGDGAAIMYVDDVILTQNEP